MKSFQEKEETKYTLNKKDKLFVDYADNITKMIQSAADNQSKLLAIINDLFTYLLPNVAQSQQQLSSLVAQRQ